MADSSSSERSDTAKEEILDRMLTRLALTDDSNLESVLSKLLPLCISFLASPSNSVRKKVMEILTHVNKRVKHQTEIQLPLSELWNMYIDADVSPMVKNFCIVYLEMAFGRLHVEEKSNWGPRLVANASKLPLPHEETILRTAAKIAGECHSSRVDESIAAKYKPAIDAENRLLFVEFCLHTILYQPLLQSGACPPGLSEAQCNRITGKLPLNGDMLLRRKLGLLNVIEAMELDPELVYPLYVAACSDCQEPVAKRGEELLKRKAATANLEDPYLINRLFLLFNGNATVENIPADCRVTPASPTLRVRLISTFCHSIAAANAFPATLQCIFGSIYGGGTTPRLRQLGMEFAVWVFKHAKVDQLKLMGPVILSGILKALDGSLNLESETTARDIKAFAFQAIGLLAQRMPQLFRDKIDMVVRLFDALKVEDQFLRPIIQETINSLAIAYKDSPQAISKTLEQLLFEYFQVDQNEVRFCALRWATDLFDMQHCSSRFICMLGAADPRMEIREMALAGLFPVVDEGSSVDKNDDLSYPKLGDMLDFICKQQPKLLDPSAMKNDMLLFPSKMYVPMIRFLLKSFESDFERSVSVGGTSEFHCSVGTFCLLLENAMAFEGSVELHSTACRSLMAIASRLPEFMATRYAGKTDWLKKIIEHVDSDARESASRLLGITCSVLSSSATTSLVSELIYKINGSQRLRFECQHGALCAIGYVTAECMTGTPSIQEQLFHRVVDCLVEVIKSESAILASIAMEALGHIALRIPLPELLNHSASVGVLISLHERLANLLSSEDIKVIQKVTLSLGHISVTETSFDNLNVALDLVFRLCRSKVEDVLFAAGEALSFIWGGVPVTADVILKSNYTSLSFSSNYLIGDSWTLPVSRYNLIAQDNNDCHVMIRKSIVAKLFDELLYSSRKEERCAGTVWLLSLVMYCGHHSKIQELLPEIQEAFSHLLGDQNDLTQELASQGMSIIYELGDSSMKIDLVNALVSTLTGSGKRKRAVKLTEDTEVFQEGSIGESLSGGKLNTYKELCNLANEMGQPDLIFKFMDLANYQALLNSKRGAAFGFSKIAKQAGDALQPHLQVLIPRLVRYQYDPDKNVQDAMGHIWKSLVSDPKKTIDDHLSLIFEDLLVQCGSRLWRSREASCLALADIIQGRKFTQVSNHLRRMWLAAFRAMDDIKETVRNAGDRLCSSVTSLTIRLCDVSLTPLVDARDTMDIVLPLLLAEGIFSKVSNIQKASINMVMKLSKGAGSAIRPHLPDLVCCMLESLSSLEDQRLNYVEFHAESVGIQSEKLENLRIAVAKDSPMWETLDFCIKVVDPESLGRLVPRLAQLVRSSVGLNTRVGVASFISLLVQKVGPDIKSYSSMLSRLLFQAVQDEKSRAAKQAFGGACALVSKYLGPSQAQKLIDDTASLHVGDKNSQISCAILFKSYTNLASDMASGYLAVIYPVIFIERFGDNKDVSGLFEELWEEKPTSDRAALQLYLAEIVSLVCDGIASSSWASKKKSANAVKRLSEVVGESLSSFQFHNVILSCLLKEMPGRLWEGKDSILYAIGALCTACGKTIPASDSTIPHTILHAIISACSKNARSFREAAFSCLQQVIQAFEYPEFFNTVFPFLLDLTNQSIEAKPVHVPFGSDATKAGDNEDGDRASVPLEKVVSCITSLIHVAMLHDILVQGKNLVSLFSYALSPGFSWTVKVSVFSSIKELCSKFPVADNVDSSSEETCIAFLTLELVHAVAPKVIECIKTVKIAQVHVAASECLLDIFGLHNVSGMKKEGILTLTSELVHLLELEKNEQARSLLRRCIDTLVGLGKEDTIQTN